ncbi:MAG: hypothetical protein ACW99J_20305 [Candidatus Thorarchaeota archaeon]
MFIYWLVVLIIAEVFMDFSIMLWFLLIPFGFHKIIGMLESSEP